MARHTIEQARQIMRQAVEGQIGCDKAVEYVKQAPKKVLLQLLFECLSMASFYKAEADRWFRHFAKVTG